MLTNNVLNTILSTSFHLILKTTMNQVTVTIYCIDDALLNASYYVAQAWTSLKLTL